MPGDETQKVGLSRRGMLQAGGIGLFGGFLGAAGWSAIESPLSRLFGGFRNNYFLNFDVNLFGNEEQAKEKLPKNLKYLVENGTYMSVRASGMVFDNMQIYQGWHTELPTDDRGSFYTRRKIGESEFALIVTSPSIGGTERFTYPTEFLGNDDIFNLIIQGVLNKGDRNQFSLFRDSYNRSSTYQGARQIVFPDDQSYPPQKASFKLVGDSVSYSVEGLEFFTGGDKEKLQREWRDRRLLEKAKA